MSDLRFIDRLLLVGAGLLLGHLTTQPVMRQYRTEIEQLKTEWGRALQQGDRAEARTQAMASLCATELARTVSHGR